MWRTYYIRSSITGKGSRRIGGQSGRAGLRTNKIYLTKRMGGNIKMLIGNAVCEVVNWIEV
jgi:hypothetical protein